MTTPSLINANSSRYTVMFNTAVEPTKSTEFTVTYDLPSTMYNRIIQGQINSHNVTFKLFPDIPYYIDQASTSFTLPEGARIRSYSTPHLGNTYSLTTGTFQDSLTINMQKVTSFDSSDFAVTYDYNPLWSSFRPALWAWALAIIGSVVIVAWRRPRPVTAEASPVAASHLRPEDIRAFVEAYEEKLKICTELDSLETKVQKGRIPRRRYKVQKKTEETRLNTITRDLAYLKEKMRATGGRYSDLTVQLEVSENEIDEVNTNMRNAEIAHERGELSLEAHRRRLDEFQRRKERAETTINGILLRLREEIH